MLPFRSMSRKIRSPHLLLHLWVDTKVDEIYQPKRWVGMRATNRLSAKKVATAGPGKYPDGAGLWLVKRDGGGAQWVLRVTIHGKRREMGLGAYPEIGRAHV